ncbi:serine/threonine-protein kinase [Haliangium ochraceum]|uniref:Serine/threonine protein kinase with TPR repeats n=1 Tax=Haliangium ochraceum (strain DSM 14365 / JCM 11303 / SMP-2) TaxID=502025 RepID=D0LS30_HALO1|nr:serine/threonine-protein kinase [Haliangium ochraceum]ACY13727.1 serine/threonine protein kinase with TPR repeats [Haliangium ochraceum DSM 14365]
MKSNDSGGLIPTLLRTEEPCGTPSAVGPPHRFGLASKLDKQHAFAGLFDEEPQLVGVGHFKLLRFLGGGGMGEVYEAYDEELDRLVALKLVRSDRAMSGLAEERLLREAQTLAQLSHPNVVQVYQAGRCSGRVYIAMELVRGRTLRSWMHERTRGDAPVKLWEIIEVMIAAGRGLQAAHEMGLVHRDFKPENVLVGDDGRPRVVDFGLARGMGTLALLEGGLSAHRRDALAQEDTAPLDERTSAMIEAATAPLRRVDRVFTSHGRLLGTPRYMAPEQMRGEMVDHRCDQFSFCVSVYEAVCGVKPFAAEKLEGLREAVIRGELQEPARGRRLPRGMRKVLLRGLSAEPDDRFSDMAALLAELSAWSTRRRRVQGGAFALALGTLVLHCAVGAREPDVCDDADERVRATWTDERRASIRDAFVRTGLPYAETTWSSLETYLDHYASELAGELVTVCEAAHELGVQSVALAEKRVMCLSSRENRLRALLELFASADQHTVEQAHRAAGALPELAPCQHTETLRYGMPAPGSGLADEVERLRVELADAHTLDLLGHRTEALDIARASLRRAEALEYVPVEAEALYQLGRMLVHDGQTRAEAERGSSMLQRAQRLAERSRHDELAAELWNQLVLGAARNDAGTERARDWFEHAEAAIARIGNPMRLRADALRNIGRVYYHESRFAQAAEYQERALSLLEQVSDAPRLLRGVYLHDLASTRRRLGAFDAAKRDYAQALAVYRSVLGEGHPYIADLRYGVAMVDFDRGSSDAAREQLAALVDTVDETLSPLHPVRTNIHVALADLERQRGALDSAHTHATAARQLVERVYGRDHVEYARASLRQGAIALYRGAYVAARDAYEGALEIFVRHLGETHLDVGLTLANLVEVELALGDYSAARASRERAEPILAPHLASIPALKPYLDSMRGQTLLGEERFVDAVRVLESALQGAAALEDVVRADTYWALARALAASGASPERTRSMARSALAIYEQQSAEMRTPSRAVRDWLEAL